MTGMFSQADLFNAAIDAWDVSSVTIMYMTFKRADVFNGAIGAWDVSSVTDMSAMFQGADDFDQDLGWCIGATVYIEAAFKRSACAKTSCGVTRGGCDE